MMIDVKITDKSYSGSRPTIEIDFLKQGKHKRS